LVGASRGNQNWFKDDGQLILNPLQSEIENSACDLVVSTTSEAVVMVEAGAKEVTEETLIKGVELALTEGKKIVDFISDFAAKMGHKASFPIKKEDKSSLLTKVKKAAGKEFDSLLTRLAKREIGYQELGEFKNSLAETLTEEDKEAVFKAVEELLTQNFRQAVLNEGKRPDGRRLDEIRELELK